MKSKIILKYLVLKGQNKKDAVLEFDGGLNVIAGASDTGKTFAFDCINYAFGSSTVPGLPPEAKGYKSVYLEIKTARDESFTIRRDFNDKKTAYWIYSSISEINDGTSFEKISAESRGAKNISNKILDICKCKYRNVLKKPASGETKKFTFRDFIPLIMVAEERVTQKVSPVHRVSPRGNTFAVSEWTAFQTVITGKDYLKVGKSDTDEIIKSHIKGQIEELESLCEELKKEIIDLKDELSGTSIEELDEKVLELQKIIDEKKEYLTIKEDEYATLIKSINKKDYEMQRIGDNILKFNLLMKNYESDIERLEFIENVHCVSEQLIDVECPICHAISKQKIEVKEKELYHKALYAEKQNIQILIKDLKATLETAEDNKHEIERNYEQLKTSINTVLKDMNDKLKPVIESNLSEIGDLLEKKELWNTIYAYDSKIEKYEEKILELESSKISTVNENKGKIKKISEDEINDFSEIIKNILVSWLFISNKTNVLFDINSKDFIIEEKNKEIFGKGARAIINSAFVIGVMKYCFNKRLSHPGVIILDTPLTTFKQKDQNRDEKDESVSKNIKMAVYEMLEKEYKEYQIIIFENEEPSREVSNKINYIHFSGNESIGRKGFIPQ